MNIKGAHMYPNYIYHDYFFLVVRNKFLAWMLLFFFI